MRPEQRDIVLLPVPFTDLSSQKRRPVIVVSNDSYHRSSADMVVVAMTSNPEVVPFSFMITSGDLEQGALNRPSTVRADKIYTLSRSLVSNIFGRVSPEVLRKIRAILSDLTSPPV